MTRFAGGPTAPIRIYLCSCGRVHVESAHHRASLSLEDFFGAMRARGSSNAAIEALRQHFEATRRVGGAQAADERPCLSSSASSSGSRPMNAR